MKKFTIILISLFFTGVLFAQNDNKALKVSDVTGTYDGYLQKLGGGRKNDIPWKAIFNEDMTFSLRAKQDDLWMEQMRTTLSRKMFYGEEGSVYYKFIPKEKNEQVKSISFSILSPDTKKRGNYKGILIIISLNGGGHLIFDVNRSGGNPTIPAALSKQENALADVTAEELDLAEKSLVIYEELYKMDFNEINNIYSSVAKNQQGLNIQQAKAKFKPVINKFKSLEKNAREAERLTQIVITTADKYGCEKTEIEYIRAAKHLRDLLSNLQMAEDRMYVAVNTPSESMTIEFFDKSNDSYNDAKDNLKAFFAAEKIAAATKCDEKITSYTNTNSNIKPRSTPKSSQPKSIPNIKSAPLDYWKLPNDSKTNTLSSPESKLVFNYMKLMRIYTDKTELTKMIAPSFFTKHKINPQDYKLNGYGPEGFQIFAQENNAIKVYIWGANQYWVHELTFVVVSDVNNHQLYIMPHNIDNYKKTDYVSPWDSEKTNINKQ